MALELGRLDALVTAAGLRWLVRVRPARLLGKPSLKTRLSRWLRTERLEVLRVTTGVRLERAPELVLAAHDGGSLVYLVRHSSDPVQLERLFRERLTSALTRADDAPGLVRVWGRIGTQLRGFLAAGRDVAGYQFEGSPRRGPLRVASLYARGKLATIPRALREPSARRVTQGWDDMDAVAWVPGPFEGESARGLHGLLGGSGGVAIALKAGETGKLVTTARVEGAFDDDAPRASRAMLAAWDHLAKSDLGHLLSLHAPTKKPIVAVAKTHVTLTTTLDGTKLLDGLAAATTDEVAEMMRGL